MTGAEKGLLSWGPPSSRCNLPLKFSHFSREIGEIFSKVMTLKAKSEWQGASHLKTTKENNVWQALEWEEPDVSRETLKVQSQRWTGQLKEQKWEEPFKGGQFPITCGFTSRCNSFPSGASGKEPACQCRRIKRWEFDPWVRRIPWRRKWRPTPVFLPGESHGQRSLVGYSP